MDDKHRIEIASRWATALTSKGAKPLAALAEVLDDDVRTTNLVGKDAVLEWFKTWPGMPMFRTGTWQEPTVEGDVVRIVSLFNPKAAFHSAKLAISVSLSGRITRATTVVLPAPDPLGSIINRVWGPRAGPDRLPAHLEAEYGVKVKKVTPLQEGNHGVHRVDLASGERWVVRVFPSDRPVADVKGDAAVLRFLESKDFPAERCVADVSVHEGQGVLVTDFVSGRHPTPNTPTEKRFGDLLGRLHAMKGGPKAVKRDAGGLHLYTVDATVRSEIDTARAALEAAAFRGTDRRWDTMMEALAVADDFSSLPKALLHPDPGAANAIASKSELIFIDWTGAGHGPRVLGLGLLLTACTSGKTFNREWADAIMGAYREHVTLDAREFDKLEAAIGHRLLIHEAYSWGVGMAQQRKAPAASYWLDERPGIAALAAYIRDRWC